MQIIEIAKNKKAFYEYHIEKVFISGLVLKGCEIKSLRNGNASLVDSYVSISPSMDQYMQLPSSTSYLPLNVTLFDGFPLVVRVFPFRSLSPRDIQ